MQVDLLFFRLYARRSGAAEPEFVGSAFPIAPGGQLLTCRHVADVGDSDLLVHDNVAARLVPVTERRFSSDRNMDLAFLQSELPADHCSFIPILEASKLLVGEEVYSYGFFMLAGSKGEIEQGYFSGRITNFTRVGSRQAVWSLTLPYPVIEGMSGSPVLTYHNGPKVVGLAYGNRSTRILAHEVLQYEDEKQKVREEIHRIVEFGLAYHAATLVHFLSESNVRGHLVSDQAVELPGL